MPETRRQALTKLLMGPLATAGLQKAIEIPADIKVLILDFTPEGQLDAQSIATEVNKVLTQAGLPNVQVLITQGLNGVAAITEGK